MILKSTFDGDLSRYQQLAEATAAVYDSGSSASGVLVGKDVFVTAEHVGPTLFSLTRRVVCFDLYQDVEPASRHPFAFDGNAHFSADKTLDISVAKINSNIDRKLPTSFALDGTTKEAMANVAIQAYKGMKVVCVGHPASGLYKEIQAGEIREVEGEFIYLKPNSLIVSGFSGGALLNSDGKLLGIITDNFGGTANPERGIQVTGLGHIYARFSEFFV
jgi:hypothetical protein